MQQRLDIFLSKRLNITRNAASKIIKADLVLINNKLLNKASFKVDETCELELKKIKPVKTSFDFDIDFELSILYEDEDILIINKNAGLVVHPAPSVKEASLVDWLLQKGYALSNINGSFRAGLVHRLDKGTSGALLVAKNNKAHAFLSKQLEDKSMGRIYLALIDLPLKNQNMINEKNIIRAENNRIKKQATLKIKGAKRAKSQFVELINNKPSLIAAKLFTGRTHQIRAHLADLNRHILGDELYGFKGKCERIMLHAYIIYFIHPKSKEKMQILAPPPDDLKAVLNKYFSKGELDESMDAAHILHLLAS